MNLKPTVIAATLAATTLVSVPVQAGLPPINMVGQSRPEAIEKKLPGAPMPDGIFCERYPGFIASALMDKARGVWPVAPIAFIHAAHEKGLYTKAQLKLLRGALVVAFEGTYTTPEELMRDGYGFCRQRLLGR